MGTTRDLIENERPTIESPNTTEDNTIGIGQTWQDVTGSRSAGVTYTNNTGKPIMVSLLVYGIGVVNFTVDGVKTLSFGGSYAHNVYVNGSVVIPVDSSYSFSATTQYIEWVELR